MDLFARKSLVYPREIRQFIDHFARKDNWHNIDKKTGNLGYGWIHYSLIRNIHPLRVLVIGSKYGYIPAICATACRDNNKGMVDFVDAGYDYRNLNHKAHWGGEGIWKKVDSKKYFGKFGLEKNITVYVMTSKKFAAKYPKRKWDYIYLDGDHSYEGVRFDFESFWPRLRKKGFISLHDIYTRNLGDLEYGVHKYWTEIKKEHLSVIELGGNCGLGILQKL